MSRRRGPREGQSAPDLRSDVLAVAQALWRRKLVVALVALLGCAGAVAVALSLPPVYTAYASVRIATAVGGMAAGGDGQLPGDVPILVESEIEALKSREVLEQVAADLDLRRAPGFAARIVGLGPDGAIRDIDVLTALWESIEIVGVGASRVISIAAESADPELSAAIANAIVRVHAAKTGEQRRAALRGAVAALEAREAELEGEISRRTDAVNAVGTAFTLLPEQEAAVLAEERASLQIAIAAAEAGLGAARRLAERLDAAEAEGRLLAEPDVRGAPEMRPLLAASASAEAAVRSVAAREGRRGPEMEAALAAQAAADAAAAAAASAVAEAARAARNGAAATVEELRARSGALDRRIVEARRLHEERARRLRALDATVAAAESARAERLDLQRRFELAGAPATPLSMAAAPPKPSGPPRKLVAAAGGLAAGFLGLLAGLALHALDRGLRTPEDVEDAVGAPVLAVAPRLRRGRRSRAIAAPEDPRSPFATALAAAALFLAPPGAEPARPRVLLVTSPRPGDGKTTITLALGRALAAAGRRVALVAVAARDAERLEAAAAAQGLPVLSDLADSDTSAADASCAVVARAAAPESLPGWSSLLADLRGRFDLVLVDGPATGPDRASAPFAALADGVAIVIRRGRTTRPALEACLRRLESVGPRPTGVVINHA